MFDMRRASSSCWRRWAVRSSSRRLASSTAAIFAARSSLLIRVLIKSESIVIVIGTVLVDYLDRLVDSPTKTLKVVFKRAGSGLPEVNLIFERHGRRLRDLERPRALEPLAIPHPYERGCHDVGAADGEHEGRGHEQQSSRPEDGPAVEDDVDQI